MKQQMQLFPEGYETYNDLVKIASSPIRPIPRLKKFYYQFDLKEVHELLEEVKKINVNTNFLLKSELELLNKLIVTIRNLRDGKRVHLINLEDTKELIMLSFKATFERMMYVLDTLIKNVNGRNSSPLEDKLIFAIRNNFRLLNMLIEDFNKSNIEDQNINKNNKSLLYFKVILRNVISINSSIALTEEEANAILDDIILEIRDIWIHYNKLYDFVVPII